MGNVILAFKRAKYMPEVHHDGPYSKKKKEDKEHEGMRIQKLLYCQPNDRTVLSMEDQISLFHRPKSGDGKPSRGEI